MDEEQHQAAVFEGPHRLLNATQDSKDDQVGVLKLDSFILMEIKCHFKRPQYSARGSV